MIPSDERAVIAKAIRSTRRVDLTNSEVAAIVLNSLRADGFELYRPEECPWVTIDERRGTEQGIEWWSLMAEKGALTDEAIYEQYRLVREPR